MGKELSLKQHKILANLGEGDTWRMAIMKVNGYTDETKDLPQKVYQQKKALMKTSELKDFLESHGVGSNMLVRKLKELLNAERIVRVGGRPVEDEAGNIVTEPENSVRVSTLSLLADIMGVKQRQRTREINKSSQQLIIIAESPEQAKRTVDDVRKEYGQLMTDPNYRVESDDGDESAEG